MNSVGASPVRPAAPKQEGPTRVREQQTPPNYIELAADLVSAFVSNNPVPAAELPTLIGTVHAALTKTANGSSQQPTEEPKKAPAVSFKKSVQPDYIVCLEDGKRFKSLKRHLRTVYDLTPAQYRAMRGLSCLARGLAKLSHFGPVMGQSGVCETVRAMSNDTAPTTMPIPQNGTVLPRPVPQAQRRPRECLTLKEVERLIAAARQNRLQGAWACLRELDSLSSSTKRVD